MRMLEKARVERGRRMLEKARVERDRRMLEKVSERETCVSSKLESMRKRARKHESE